VVECVIDLPQLIGMHGTPPYTTVSLVVPLPSQFSTIDAASLRLTGEQFPGTGVSVIGNNHRQWLVSAVLQLEDTPPPPYYPFPYFFHQLPTDLHDFSIEETIGAPYQPKSDFRYWLDGTAEFSFSVGPPMTVATSAYAVYPLVEIDHAELVISGQPIAVPEPTTIYLGVLAAGAALCALRHRKR